MKISLPPGWALTPALQAGEMWRDYQEVRVVVAVQENEVWLFIHLPMLEFLRALTLYRVISLSRATQKSTRGMQCEGLPAYLVVSSDREMFVKINAEIAGQCCSPGQALCPIKQAMNRKKARGVCSVSVFLAEEGRMQIYFTAAVAPWRGQDAVYLEHRRYQPSPFTKFSCPVQPSLRTGCSRRVLEGIHLDKSGCSEEYVQYVGERIGVSGVQRSRVVYHIRNIHSCYRLPHHRLSFFFLINHYILKRDILDYYLMWCT
ncbi:hypothetical protein OUZ56_028003 [Daphnia magna]|uniref:Uncharacterized protein n=1 Tax=Daphnia magna TaxID=35525 RepID=A0ABR0B2P6_9CRUS|nr:hypothetical protein OUZ56_028003 [Daphnia magna]